MNEKFEINFNWQDGEGIEGEELKSTFATLSVNYGDEFITEVKNKKTGTLSESLNIPLYPHAEWLV
ncbi:MAG: hypothetical protein ABEH43_03005, partial [Flavobacteriales bacterium]